MNRAELEQRWNFVVDWVESIPLVLATRFGPWLTPAVPAFFVHKAMIKQLETPIVWAWVAAIALEVVGLASVWSLLRAYQWNREKRKSDPAAPLKWNVVAASTYYVTAFILVLFIEFWPDVIRFAPAAFIVLSGTSALVLALIADQSRREREVDVSNRRKMERKMRVKQDAAELSKNSVKNGDFTSINASRQDEKESRQTLLLDAFLDNPEAGPTTLARRLGVSRQTVYNDLADLEKSGRIAKNGKVEVIT